MATITSSAPGNWSTGGTWVGGVAPGNGDIALVQHAITVDVNTIIGNSPAEASGTAVIQISSAGQVVIPEGKSLTVRGDITHANPSGVVILPILDIRGGSLIMDVTQSSSPTTTAYTISPTSDNQTRPLYKTRLGATGTRSVIKSLRTNGNEKRSYFFLNSHLVNLANADFEDTDFTDLGDATNPWFSHYSGLTSSFMLTRCTVNSCGLLDCASVLNAAANFILQDSTWTGTLSTNAITIFGLSAVTSGSRIIDGCYVDKVSQYGFMASFIITNNLFMDTWVEVDGFGPTTFQENVIYKQVQASFFFAGLNYKNNYIIEAFQGVNPQGFIMGNSTQDQTMDGMIGQIIRTGAVSDIEVCIGGGSNTALTKTIKNCLVLPSSDFTTGLATDETSGNLFVGLGNSAKMVYEHNTCKGGRPADFNQPIWLNHPGTSVPSNSIISYKSNLYWDSSVKGNHVQYTQTPVQNDILTPTAVTNNGNYNASVSAETGSTGSHYSYPTTSMPGTNDVNDQNPRFIDPTRNFEGYSASLGGARSAVATLALIKSDCDFHTHAIINWVKAGFAPTNTAYKGTAHDGGDIGAVAYTTPPGGSNKFSISLGLSIS